MKCTTILDTSREEEVLIVAHRKTALVEDIERLVKADDDRLIGYQGKEAVVLDPTNICCFAVEDHKVYAHTADGVFLIKRRLYELEDTLPHSFVKLHQSCLGNMRQIQKFDASVGGTLRVVFRNGHTDYVSRRQLKTVKERFGL